MQVRIEVLPWLSETLGGSLSRKVVFEETVPEGETLCDLLMRLRERPGRFGPLVFDAQRKQLTGQAEVVVNGTIYDAAGGLDTALHEGDTITFMPGLAGGEPSWANSSS